MLSVDTPEVTARNSVGAKKVDAEFEELAKWILDGIAPVTKRFRDHILPRLESKAGTQQFEQGKAASTWFKARVDKRLKRSSGRRRNLFVRTAEVRSTPMAAFSPMWRRTIRQRS